MVRNMRVQSMLAKDSVNKRIHSENSMSFAEFAYQCLQANDYLYLHKNYGCICQIGGSDQWETSPPELTSSRKPPTTFRFHLL